MLPFNDTGLTHRATEAVGVGSPRPAPGTAQEVCLLLPLPEPFHAQIPATAARPVPAQRLQQYPFVRPARLAASSLGARQAGWPGHCGLPRQSARFRDR
ncbi:hypothetical protein AERO9A_420222 [Aeromonas salmonicida]|nr:hypothetical protein AERO9A_420222 [Aeromonas salmonicida]